MFSPLAINGVCSCVDSCGTHVSLLSRWCYTTVVLVIQTCQKHAFSLCGGNHLSEYRLPCLPHISYRIVVLSKLRSVIPVSTIHLYNICTPSAQRRTTMYKSYANVLCLLEYIHNRSMELTIENKEITYYIICYTWRQAIMWS